MKEYCIQSVKKIKNISLRTESFIFPFNLKRTPEFAKIKYVPSKIVP